MNNYEKITSSPEFFALWLEDGRLNCVLCPVETKRCFTDDVGCYDMILDWLMSEVKSDEV